MALLHRTDIAIPHLQPVPWLAHRFRPQPGVAVWITAIADRTAANQVGVFLAAGWFPGGGRLPDTVIDHVVGYTGAFAVVLYYELAEPHLVYVVAENRSIAQTIFDNLLFATPPWENDQFFVTRLQVVYVRNRLALRQRQLSARVRLFFPLPLLRM